MFAFKNGASFNKLGYLDSVYILGTFTTVEYKSKRNFIIFDILLFFRIKKKKEYNFLKIKSVK